MNQQTQKFLPLLLIPLVEILLRTNSHIFGSISAISIMSAVEVAEIIYFLIIFTRNQPVLMGRLALLVALYLMLEVLRISAHYYQLAFTGALQVIRYLPIIGFGLLVINRKKKTKIQLLLVLLASVVLVGLLSKFWHIKGASLELIIGCIGFAITYLYYYFTKNVIQTVDTVKMVLVVTLAITTVLSLQHWISETNILYVLGNVYGKLILVLYAVLALSEIDLVRDQKSEVD